MPGRSQIVGSMEKEARPWLPPMSLLAVAGATDPDHEIILLDELTKGRQLEDEEIPLADVYAFSWLSTSRKGAIRLAKMLRPRGKPLIAGGMDVTGLFHEGNHHHLLDYFDTIVVGRLTNRLWREILADAAREKLQPVYQAEASEPWEFFVPRHDLVNTRKYIIPAAVQTSAGCNESCDFCTVHLVIGARRGIRLKPPAALERELELLPKSRYLFDCSDSFGTDICHTLEILPVLKDSGKDWFCESTIKNLLGISSPGEGERPELVKILAKNRSAGVCLGLESIEGKVSGKSLGIAKAEEAIKKVHDQGMLVMVSIILDVRGDETWETIERTVEWVKSHRPDFVQFSLLALLPGCARRKQALAKGWVIDNNPEHLDGAWPTIEHQMSPAERIRALQYAYRETYSASSIWHRLGQTPWRRRPIVAAANTQIHFTAKGWEQRGTYEHWLATRETMQ